MLYALFIRTYTSVRNSDFSFTSFFENHLKFSALFPRSRTLFPLSAHFSSYFTTPLELLLLLPPSFCYVWQLMLGDNDGNGEQH
jgi:hypothetical protein